MYAESIFSIFAQQNLSHSTLSQDQKKTQISKIKKQNKILKMAKSSYSTLVFFLKKKDKKGANKRPIKIKNKKQRSNACTITKKINPTWVSLIFLLPQTPKTKHSRIIKNSGKQD